MKRMVCFALLLMVMAAMAASAFAAAGELPEYGAERLSQQELKAFFEADCIFNNEFGATLPFFRLVYDKLENKDETIYGMRFTAKETVVEAENGEWATHIVDFEVGANQAVSVIVAGNYGMFGTVVVPMVWDLEANKDKRVMAQANFYLKYPDIVRMVQTFECVAIPVTKELQDAFRAAQAEATVEVLNPTTKELIEKVLETPVASPNTVTSLELNLYETDPNDPNRETGKVLTVSKRDDFIYDYVPVNVSLPKTGDTSSLMLWTALLGMAAAGMAILRGRKALKA